MGKVGIGKKPGVTVASWEFQVQRLGSGRREFQKQQRTEREAEREASGAFPELETTAPGLPRATATDYKSQAALRRRAPGAILVGGAD